MQRSMLLCYVHLSDGHSFALVLFTVTILFGFDTFIFAHLTLDSRVVVTLQTRGGGHIDACMFGPIQLASQVTTLKYQHETQITIKVEAQSTLFTHHGHTSKTLLLTEEQLSCSNIQAYSGTVH